MMYAKYSICLFCIVSILAFSCEDEQIIVSEEGFNWPQQTRTYWPTDGWRTESLEDHQMDPVRMEEANEFAKNDPLARALLVVKDGYLVYEKYYGNGTTGQSTNLWSVTKSITSALVGILLDEDLVQSTDQHMAELMPLYPEFNDITLHHVLTMTTGLSWEESGPRWVEWIFSDDWVASALARGQKEDPGNFFYSSGNSQFLTALVAHKTGKSPGKLAKERLFDPMGIVFDTISSTVTYNRWEEYTERLSQTWRKDPNGIECAGFGLYLTARDMAKFGYLYLNRGHWDGQSLVSGSWIDESIKDHETNIYGRYSYVYHWWLTRIDGKPAFLASGFGGQIIGIVPSLDLVVVLKYEAENPEHPEAGTAHDDIHLFELVVKAVE